MYDGYWIYCNITSVLVMLKLIEHFHKAVRKPRKQENMLYPIQFMALLYYCITFIRCLVCAVQCNHLYHYQIANGMFNVENNSVSNLSIDPKVKLISEFNKCLCLCVVQDRVHYTECHSESTNDRAIVCI